MHSGNSENLLIHLLVSAGWKCLGVTRVHRVPAGGGRTHPAMPPVPQPTGWNRMHSGNSENLLIYLRKEARSRTLGVTRVHRVPAGGGLPQPAGAPDMQWWTSSGTGCSRVNRE